MISRTDRRVSGLKPSRTAYERVRPSLSGCCELAEVVGGADHRPFGPDVGETSGQELAEAARLLDLAEDRFEDRKSVV